MFLYGYLFISVFAIVVFLMAFRLIYQSEAFEFSLIGPLVVRGQDERVGLVPGWRGWLKPILWSTCLILAALATLQASTLLFPKFDPNSVKQTSGLGARIVFGFLALLAGWYLTSKFFPATSWFLKTPLVLLVGFGWIVAPSWVTQAITFTTFSVVGLYSLGSVALRYVLVALLFWVFYDIYGVFIGGQIVQVAFGMSSLTPPVVLVVPQDPAMVFGLDPLFRMGSGDILIPGVAVVASSRFGLWRWGVAGYLFGVLLAMAFAVIFHTATPMTMFLNPIVFSAIVLGAKAKGIKLPL